MEKFNAPPGWPKPPQNWMPKPGWKPEPSWAKAPDNWNFWINEWGEPVAGPPGLYGSADVDATTAFNPEIASETTTSITTAVPNTSQTQAIPEKTGVIAGAMKASRERGAERAAAEARGTIPHPDDDDSARKAVKWVAGVIVASVVFLALMAAFFHRSSTPAPAKKTSTSTPSSYTTPLSQQPVRSSEAYTPTATTPLAPTSTTVPAPTSTSVLPTSTVPSSSLTPFSTYTSVTPTSEVTTRPEQTSAVPTSTTQATVSTAPATTR